MQLQAAPSTAPDTPVIVCGNGKKYHSADCTYAKSDKDKRIRELEYEVAELKELLEEYVPQYNF